jgi:hypothetical protein
MIFGKRKVKVEPVSVLVDAPGLVKLIKAVWDSSSHLSELSRGKVFLIRPSMQDEGYWVVNLSSWQVKGLMAMVPEISIKDRFGA